MKTIEEMVECKESSRDNSLRATQNSPYPALLVELEWPGMRHSALSCASNRAALKSIDLAEPNG